MQRDLARSPGGQVSRRWKPGELVLCLCKEVTPGEPRPALYRALAHKPPTILDRNGAEHRCPTAEFVPRRRGRVPAANPIESTNVSIRMPSRVRDKLYRRAGGRGRFAAAAIRILLEALAPEEIK